MEEGFFGEKVRYGLCPEGAIGLFEKKTTGGRAYYRLRGVYLEEELVDALRSSKQRLFAIYPAIVVHEVCHAWEYDRTHHEEWYGRLTFDFYPRDTFYEHLDELQVDARGMELLRQLHFEIPLHKGRDVWSHSYMTQSEVELQRFRQFDDEGRLVEIMGEKDLEWKMFLKFARNLGRLLFVVSREGAEANQWLPRIKAWRTEAHQFLQRFTGYPKCRFEEVAQLSLEYLAMQQPEFTIKK